MKFLRIGLWSAACAVMAVLLLTTAVGCMADHYIFQPPRGNPVSSRKMELLPVEEKISIAVCHLPAPSEEGFTILYSHGNAEDLSGLRYRLPQFPAHGYGIIAYDYAPAAVLPLKKMSTATRNGSGAILSRRRRFRRSGSFSTGGVSAAVRPVILRNGFRRRRWCWNRRSPVRLPWREWSGCRGIVSRISTGSGG